MESNAQNYIMKWQTESERLNEYLMDYQNNYILIEEHENILRSRENEFMKVNKML